MRRKVLAELHARGLLSSERFEMLLSWRRSGFSVHAGEPVRAGDQAALERLARYVRRLHLAESRIHYDEERDQVIYSSGKKPHPGFKANFRVFAARDFVAAVCGFVPDPYRHETVAYGEYSNAVRGRRRKRAATATDPEVCPVPPARARAAWRELIEHVYEVDPLLCRRCGAELRIVSLVTRRDTVERILRHLGLWPPPSRPPRPPPRPPAPGADQGPPPASPDESERSQVPAWWDDDEAFSQVPSGWDS